MLCDAAYALHICSLSDEHFFELALWLEWIVMKAAAMKLKTYVIRLINLVQVNCTKNNVQEQEDEASNTQYVH